MQLVYCAAHGGFAPENVPLGGGAAIFEMLREEWSRTQPFELSALTPAILGDRAPSGRDLAGYSEGAYARFCYAFEAEATRRILAMDAAQTAVLVNDVSEGPDFAALAARGFRIATIYHVDVVAYIAAIYCRGWISARALARMWRALGPVRALTPKILRLVFEKQAASVLHSRALIVMTESMKRTLLSCYPDTPPEKIQVVPWGSPPAQRGREGLIRREYGVPPDAFVILALSRISPEKGQDRLLDALLEWENAPDFPRRPVWLFLCGGAAFMRGRRFEEELRNKASRLRRVRVRFPGHVTGGRKQDFFAAADVYAFPSRHESYGLTMMEAMGAGLPVAAFDHDGARAILADSGAGRPAGLLANGPGEFRRALGRLEHDAGLRLAMAQAASEYAAARPFSRAAAEVARLAAGIR